MQIGPELALRLSKVKQMLSDGTRKKALIAEDDSVLREALARVLEKDYVVFVACDGVEALIHAQSVDFDLLLTDLRMPGVDGITLAERIRDFNPNIKIVLHTASGTVDLDARAHQAGVDRVVNKGVGADELRSVLASALIGEADRSSVGPTAQRDHWEPVTGDMPRKAKPVS